MAPEALEYILHLDTPIETVKSVIISDATTKHPSVLSRPYVESLIEGQSSDTVPEEEVEVTVEEPEITPPETSSPQPMSEGDSEWSFRVEKNPDPEKVKKLFFDLWKIFPNSVYEEKVIREIIITQHVRDQLVEQKFLYKEPYKAGENEGCWYGIGGNGINLVIAWETQKLTKRAVIIALISLGLSILALSISLMK